MSFWICCDDNNKKSNTAILTDQLLTPGPYFMPGIQKIINHTVLARKEPTQMIRKGHTWVTMIWPAESEAQNVLCEHKWRKKSILSEKTRKTKGKACSPKGALTGGIIQSLLPWTVFQVLYNYILICTKAYWTSSVIPISRLKIGKQKIKKLNYLSKAR